MSTSPALGLSTGLPSGARPGSKFDVTVTVGAEVEAICAQYHKAFRNEPRLRVDKLDKEDALGRYDALVLPLLSSFGQWTTGGVFATLGRYLEDGLQARVQAYIVPNPLPPSHWPSPLHHPPSSLLI